MLKKLKALFSSDDSLKPNEYTTVTYHEGREYLQHDGLGLKTPPSTPDQEIGGDPASIQRQVHHAPAETADMESESDDEGFFSSMDINPATGLFMLNGMVDTGGNMYGFNNDDGIGVGSAFDNDSGFDDSPISSFDDDL